MRQDIFEKSMWLITRMSDMSFINLMQGIYELVVVVAILLLLIL